MRYAVWTSLLVLSGVGLLVASCEDVTQDCTLNPAILCPGETRGVAGSGGATTTGIGGTGDCTSDAMCPDDMDACTKSACVEGACKSVPDLTADNKPCGSSGAPVQLHCSMGVCVGCMADGDCQVGPCKVYTCKDQKCEPQDKVNDAELAKLQIAGDCHQAYCTDGAPVTPGNVDVDDKPDPMGDTNLCHQWDCAADGTPVKGTPLADGSDCGVPTCGLSADAIHSEQTVQVCLNDQCQAAATTSCGSYACDSTTSKCRTSCTVEADCFSYNYCDTGKAECLPVHINGDACTDNNECQSGICTDGVCCGSFCDGLCQACNLSGTEGACINLPAGTVSVVDCAAPQVCDGLTMCVLPPGQPCVNGFDCQGGNCKDGFCCDSPCIGKCQSCAVAGSYGKCTPIPKGTDPDNECALNGNIAAVCNGSSACKLPDGQACGADSDCLNGHCEDKLNGVGVCCDVTCGVCKSCRQALSGQPDGTCANETNGTVCGVGKSCTNGVCQ